MKKRACACVCQKKVLSLQPILKIEKETNPTPTLPTRGGRTVTGEN